jgi:hypothetical protein
MMDQLFFFNLKEAYGKQEKANLKVEYIGDVSQIEEKLGSPIMLGMSTTRPPSYLNLSYSPKTPLSS